MKQGKQKMGGLILCVIIECLVLAALIFGCVFSEIRRNVPQQTLPDQTATTYSAPTQAPTEQPAWTQPTGDTTVETTTAPWTQAPTEATETEATESAETTEEKVPETTEPLPQPGELTAHLQRNGMSYASLEQADCTQLVVVAAKGVWSQIQYYEYTDGVWKEKTELKCEGRVGRNGVSNQKREGDGATPAGLFPINEGFYIDQRPQTGLDTFQITQDTYWVDDPNSAFYNQRVEGTEEKDWNSAEHMISFSEYHYGFVIGYNMPVKPGVGSAIFFHIGDSATVGCVATEERMVLAYLKELDKTCHPHILILN